MELPTGYFILATYGSALLGVGIVALLLNHFRTNILKQITKQWGGGHPRNTQADEGESGGEMEEIKTMKDLEALRSDVYKAEEALYSQKEFLRDAEIRIVPEKRKAMKMFYNARGKLEKANPEVTSFRAGTGAFEEHTFDYKEGLSSSLENVIKYLRAGNREEAGVYFSHIKNLVRKIIHQKTGSMAFTAKEGELGPLKELTDIYDNINNAYSLFARQL